MSDLYQLFAALSAGIAAASVFLFAAGLFFAIRMESIPVQDVSERKSIPILFRLFLPFAPNVYPLLRSNIFAPMLAETRDRLLMAGYEQTMSAEHFMAARVLMFISGVVFTLLALSAKQPSLALLCVLILILYPSAWLKSQIRKRHLSILKALPNLLDLLTLSVEAGKDFLTALREITDRRANDPLNEELVRTLHEIQLGKARQTALKEMSARVRQSDLNSVLNAIIQADELGVSIGQLLRIQGDQLRAKRFARAEKLANEAPVKILFPVVIFIFPAVFLILMGPILSQAMRALFNS